jgi:short-subunit dehydrogenase
MIPGTEQDLTNRIAVVTGAGSGIGKAVARALAVRGARVCLVGRRRDVLEDFRAELAAAGWHAETHSCDLSRDEAIFALRDALTKAHGRVDVLVHSAGTIVLGPIATAPIADLDEQFRVNVRAPYLLTQSLLPLIAKVAGQIVFVNSSLAVRTKESAGAYAATKHALKAVADTLRMEVNSMGVRVVSIYPGNTATPMQERIQQQTGEVLDASCMLQPEDVAAAIVETLSIARSAEVTDLHVRPMRKAP